MPKILIIDDEKVIRSTLKEILEYEKYEIAEAQDGEQGLKMIQEEDLTLSYAISKCLKWMVSKFWKMFRNWKNNRNLS
jgi:CheY-like chemotaxis protein